MLRFQGEYELNTGKAIVRRFIGLDPMATPAVLVAGHAPFTWGKTPMEAAHNAVILEYVARMAFTTTVLRPEGAGVSQALLDRHYFRKPRRGCNLWTEIDVFAPVREQAGRRSQLARKEPHNGGVRGSNS